MLNHDPHSRVTVEDLLRLKRAERPSVEFWNAFERDLRQKQLSALLEKRPWWQEVPRWTARHAYFPLGAAAAMAFAFVTIRNQATSPLAVGEAILPVTVEHAALPETFSGQTRLNLAESEVPALATPTAAASVQTPALATTIPGDVGEWLPWSAPRTIETPSAKSIAATLARLEETQPELLENMRGTRLAPVSARIQPAADRAVMELASVSVTSPAAPRRSTRLLAGFEQREFAPEPTAPDLVRERIARRLGDPDLLDEVRRLDLKGDRLSLKL